MSRVQPVSAAPGHQAAPAPAAPAGTAADTPAVGAGAGRPEKEHFPGQRPFSEWPADFDPKKHKALTEKDFDGHNHVFLEHRGNRLIEQGKKLLERAEQYRKYGDAKTMKAMQKFEKTHALLASLQETLQAAGVDVEELMAKAETREEEAAAA